ncbi:peptidase T [Dellaglioa algida]|uniref:peptidase T n=1 Tax=Dellaglioa algida TaxID=105612 RepID=UPI000BD1E341|nr:peptidase T [Dellaglioa algida]MDK1718080.1 peptidase T [Dellaglioa algida]MDK1729151.1 peptidase T [Dellaglioa algida]MDK1741585.1 peptidase T [Dellaglioa algida]SOB49662.1 peptidase T (tripeptidase) [Dellaglioa algida]
MTKYEELIPRFIKYVKTETRSDENSGLTPSTQTQVEFAKELKKELLEIGLTDARISEKSGYVLATLPSNLENDVKVKAVGFISHMDTADFTAEGVNPQFVENYDGESDINLDDEGKFKLTVKEFPNLKNYKGNTLITTDGSTLLGSDDKSGVAEIFTAVAYLVAHPEIKHGDVKVGIGPDEEIGVGADKFDVKDFGADLAYTVDGGPLGELEYETFNAAQAVISIQGKEVHPATAKGVLINANKLASQFDSLLPQDEVPEKTEGREGFYHLISVDGTVDEAKMVYIIRDHDHQKFEDRKKFMMGVADKMNAEFDTDRVTIDMADQYYNMREVIEKDMTVVNVAQQAMENLSIKPDIYPVRGGTDGSKISFMGLPTPNLFAGAENMHARFEFVSVETMEKATDVVLEIVKLVSEETK